MVIKVLVEVEGGLVSDITLHNPTKELVGIVVLDYDILKMDQVMDLPDPNDPYQNNEYCEYETKKDVTGKEIPGKIEKFKKKVAKLQNLTT